MTLANLLRTVEQGARDLATVDPETRPPGQSDIPLLDTDWDFSELEDGVLPDYPRIRGGADERGKPW